MCYGKVPQAEVSPMSREAPVASETAPPNESTKTPTARLSALDASLRTVVVDALNFLDHFVPVVEKRFANATPWELWCETHRRVDALLRAFDNSAIHPIFVIDSGFESEEVAATWRMRRIQEVIREKRRMPYNADTAFAAILIHLGADVVRPHSSSANVPPLVDARSE